MNLVSVTRILNEDDIVEAFVRHNAASLTHMIFLDNGSTDRTVDILRALKEDGLPLSVFQGLSLTFDEVSANTWLYRLADQLHKADWVVFLDADEFLNLPPAVTLAAVLGAQAANAVEIKLIHYYETPEDDTAELIIPLRLRWRMIPPTNVLKTGLRGGYGPRIVIDAGNHGAYLDGKPLGASPEPRLTLAHYPRRNGWQNLQKIATGWLKVLAAGQPAIAANRSTHYRSPFETLRDKPHELLGNPLYLQPGVDRTLMREEPLAYRGGPLRHTAAVDPAFHAFTLGLRYAEQLARQHGRLLDQSTEARNLVEAWNGGRKFLF